VLAVVTVVAFLVPARRATRVNAAIALRDCPDNLTGFKVPSSGQMCYRAFVGTSKRRQGMADAQLSSSDPVRAVLLENHDEFRQLVSEHHRLDERIQQLSSLFYLTDQQQFEEISLKKRKLALKDRIESIVRQHHASSPAAMRTQ
jgi:uncharacterized protein YdcH (DUF465 family)